jgi:hypothetical protein
MWEGEEISESGDGASDSDDPAPGAAALPALTAAECTLFLLDWMTSHKVTDSAARDIWKVVKMLLPPNVKPKSVDQVKAILDKFEASTVERIDVCPNDCVAYWDSKHLPVAYRHYHRTKCPVCNAPRYVQDPADGKQRAAKVVISRAYELKDLA